MLVLQSPVRFDTEHYGPGWHTHQLSDEWYISQAVAGCYMIRWRFIRAMHALHANTGTSTFCLSNRRCAVYGVCDGHALLHAEMTRHLRRCGYSIENLQLFQPLNRLLSSHCAYSGTGEIAIFCPKGPAVACFFRHSQDCLHARQSAPQADLDSTSVLLLHVPHCLGYVRCTSTPRGTAISWGGYLCRLADFGSSQEVQ